MTRLPIYLALVIVAWLAMIFGNGYRPQCYEIVPEAKQSRQIKLNKCTGEAWMLNYTTIVDDNGKKTGEFAYRWNPLATSPNEALLSYK